MRTSAGVGGIVAGIREPGGGKGVSSVGLRWPKTLLVHGVENLRETPARNSLRKRARVSRKVPAARTNAVFGKLVRQRAPANPRAPADSPRPAAGTDPCVCPRPLTRACRLPTDPTRRLHLPAHILEETRQRVVEGAAGEPHERDVVLDGRPLQPDLG